MIQYRELLMQSFLHVQVILGHKRHIMLYVRSKWLILQMILLLLQWSAVQDNQFFNRKVIYFRPPLNEKLGILDELLYTCNWKSIHWEYFVITMHFCSCRKKLI